MRYSTGLKYAIALTAAAALGTAGAGCSDNNNNNPDSGVAGRSGSGGIGGHGGSGGGGGLGGSGGSGGTGGGFGTGGGGGFGTGGFGAGGHAGSGGSGGAGTGGAGGGNGGRAGTGGAGGLGGGRGGQAGGAGRGGAAGGAAGAAGGAGGGGGAAVVTLNDGQIVAILLDANAGEVHTANIADLRATDGDVRSFAMQLDSDHTDAETRLNGLVQSEGFNVQDSPVRQMVAAMANQTVDSLWMVPMSQFDVSFVQAQIMLHMSVLDLLNNTLLPQTTSGALRSEVQMEATMVQQHLTAAQTLLTALTTSTGTGGGGSGGGTP
jgi:predicted outer membrane protein